VLLPGVSSSVEKWYVSSHLFCLPSQWEGFPNALAEALAHGLPGVGFAGCAGVRDLIVHGINGYLADSNGDVVTLAKALEVLMSNPCLRASMSPKAIESVGPFEAHRIFSQWEKLLSEVAQL
jgi:glycosyltransferase involved in cell wall biosynthesis